MKTIFYLLGTMLCLHCSSGFASHRYYVSPQGDDAGTGSEKAPFATLQRAQQEVAPGDTVYIRGGIYRVRPEQLSGNVEFQNHYYTCYTHFTRSGTPQQRICYFAYPGEKPMFDLSQIKPAGKRVSAFWNDADWLHIKGIEVTGVQVTVTGENTQSECFSNSGSHNIYEQLEMHDGMAIGFFSRQGGDNLILNCDAYRNYDPVADTAGAANGGNVDGFGSHYSTPGDGPNIFWGCRAWHNSDDGFDCIGNGEATIIENCWAFYNGYSYEGEKDAFHSRGDGNGFKCGGYHRNPRVSMLPKPVPRNIIRFCIAVGNKNKGFDANHHAAGNFWQNNTAYRNKYNFHMDTAGKILPADTVLTFVPGRNHVLINNLSYKGTTSNLARIDLPTCILLNNDFDLEGDLTDACFISLDEKQLVAPRRPDGSLPDLSFLKLKGENLQGIFAKP